MPLTLDGWVQVAWTVFLKQLGASHMVQLMLCLPIILPVLSGTTANSKLQVKVRQLITGGPHSQTHTHLYAVVSFAPSLIWIFSDDRDPGRD